MQPEIGHTGITEFIRINQLANNNLVAITCGANLNFERLRFIAERAVLGENKEAMIAVEIKEEAGSLKKLC